MSFYVVSCSTCFPRASSASATSASSPAQGAPFCYPGVSPLCTPLHPKTTRKRPPLLQRTRCGVVPSAADPWRSSNDSPWPRSNSVLHLISSWLLHETTRPQPELSAPFRASRPTLSPFLPTTFFPAPHYARLIPHSPLHLRASSLSTNLCPPQPTSTPLFTPSCERGCQEKSLSPPLEEGGVACIQPLPASPLLGGVLVSLLWIAA
jgi:hypothetical protein